MTVVATNPNATSEVLAHSRHNAPPPEGNQFYMVTLRSKYIGEGTSRFRDDLFSSVKSVRQSSIVYGSDVHCASRYVFGSNQDQEYGISPDDLYYAPEVLTGGEIMGDTCWEIASTEADSLEMFVEAREQRTRERVRIWFALR